MMKARYFVTMYNLYPIYEPAEGGYYYNGVDVQWSFSFREFRKAIRFLKKCYKECIACGDNLEKGWYCSDNHQFFGVGGSLIGEGWFVKLERTQGESKRGWRPYE